MPQGRDASRLTRRGFLGRSVAAAGALAGGALPATLAGAQDEPQKRVVYRTLGRTGFKVSHVVAAWDWNEWLYGEAVDAGINYWHKIAGWPQLPDPIRALDREAWYCDIAIDSFEEDGAYEQFEWARKNLGLEYIDAMKLHSICKTPEDVTAKTGYLKAFERLKGEGKVRHLAAAQHGAELPAICAAMIESGHFDHLQPALSVAPTPDVLTMLELAKQHNVGIIAKKVMGGVNRAKQDAQVRAEVEKHLGKDGKWGAAVIKTVLSYPGVTAVTPRCANYQQFVENLSTEGLELTPGEVGAVEAIRRYARAEQCSYCGKCLASCPQGVAIADTLRYATYCLTYGLATQAGRLYARLPAERRAEACRDCGTCERVCPQGMKVRRKLREAVALIRTPACGQSDGGETVPAAG
jgi:predicted aldo/keto reductase-like oxidoreductase